MPAIDLRAARAQVRLAEVLDLAGFTPTARRGPQLRGPCPVHRSRGAASRSLAAHPGKGVGHCFACGAGGNVLDLWAAVTQQALYAAALDWSARLGRGVPRLAAAPAPRGETNDATTMT